MLLLSLPLILVTALLIKLDSPGPVFYKQQRVGKGGRVFTVYKFRSMRSDAEQKGARWAQKRDPRVTRVGKWIRMFRIDEIPQIWNVLIGEMSLVGPRPERPEFVKELDVLVPYYCVRHTVNPRNHRLGADQLSLRRNHRGIFPQTRIRSLLRKEHVHRPRPPDPGQNGRGCDTREKDLDSSCFLRTAIRHFFVFLHHSQAADPQSLVTATLHQIFVAFVSRFCFVLGSGFSLRPLR